jgi:hypothetical protein
MHIFIIENFGFDLQEGDAKLLQKMNGCSVLAFRLGVLNSDIQDYVRRLPILETTINNTLAAF